MSEVLLYVKAAACHPLGFLVPRKIASLRKMGAHLGRQKEASENEERSKLHHPPHPEGLDEISCGLKKSLFSNEN